MKAQGQHVTYELHTLGWKAFQDLCLTIVKEVFGQNSQMNAYVKDLGKDIIYIGHWIDKNGKQREGLTLVQCKHSCDSNKKLVPSDVSGEIEKVRKIHLKEPVNTYTIMTNMEVTGDNETKIKDKFKLETGISNIEIYANVWINRAIHDNCSLRMSVPRIYGLGDLSQILDE